MKVSSRIQNIGTLLCLVSVAMSVACDNSGGKAKRAIAQCATDNDSYSANPKSAEKFDVKKDLSPGSNEKLEDSVYSFSEGRILFHDKTRDIKVGMKQINKNDGSVDLTLECVRGKGVRIDMVPLTMRVPVIVKITQTPTETAIVSKLMSVDLRIRPKGEAPLQHSVEDLVEAKTDVQNYYENQGLSDVTQSLLVLKENKGYELRSEVKLPVVSDAAGTTIKSEQIAMVNVVLTKSPLPTQDETKTE
jgi:hypothetical protein